MTYSQRTDKDDESDLSKCDPDAPYMHCKEADEGKYGSVKK